MINQRMIESRVTKYGVDTMTLRYLNTVVVLSSKGRRSQGWKVVQHFCRFKAKMIVRLVAKYIYRCMRPICSPKTRNLGKAILTPRRFSTCNEHRSGEFH